MKSQKLKVRVISSYHSLHLLYNKIKWFHFDSNLINVEISIRSWQDEIEGMLSISNSNRKNKTLGILSNTLHKCYKNQNLWEEEGGGGGGFFRDYIRSFLCSKYLFDIQVDNITIWRIKRTKENKRQKIHWVLPRRNET